MNQTALLVVDMQRGAFDGARIPAMQNGTVLVERVKNLIANARAKSLPVVYVQHRGEVGMNHAFEPDTEHFAIDARIAPELADLVIHKSQGSAFANTALDEQLRAHDIDSLVICGLQSEYCVTDTTLDALDAGYHVTVAADAHGTWDSSEGEAAALISERQNEVFAQRGAKVIPAAIAL